MALLGGPCPFCRIVRGEDAVVREVYRDEKVVAFFPTEPAVLGHTLVIPRKHAVYAWDLDTEDAKHLGVVTTRMARVVKETLGAEGVNIIQSNGEVATQSVPHVHYHVVPRWSGDAIGRMWTEEIHYSRYEKDETWAVLKAAFGQLLD